MRQKKQIPWKTIGLTLLAALVGGAVFMGDYVVSRYGTAGGSASEDYTTFDEDDPDDADGSGSFAWAEASFCRCCAIASMLAS